MDTTPDPIAHLDLTPVPAKQPGWSRWTVREDGVTLGVVDRHETPAGVRWYAADPRWNGIGPQDGFPDRRSALTALASRTAGGAS